MVNTMDQWVQDFTRYRGKEKPYVLDVVQEKEKKKKKPLPTIKYQN